MDDVDFVAVRVVIEAQCHNLVIVGKTGEHNAPRQ